MRIIILILLFFCTSQLQGQKLKALVIDGQNNHNMWPKTSFMMKQYLEETGLYEKVDIERTYYTWNGKKNLIEKYPIAKKTELLEKPKSDPNYKPDFSKYDVVITNFGWNAAPWPDETQAAFESYIKAGGGLVVVHAADNSFPNWPAYNTMIGLGGWGNRTEKDGPYVYYNKDGKLVKDKSAGRGGAHGPQHEYQVQVRKSSHPITKGLPPIWLHTKDELYDRLRGPAKKMKVLATSFSATDKKGTDRHEPMLISIKFGKGRIFHTPMGHADYSMECVGFITVLKRGAEWAASGKVTQTAIPEDFPTANKTSSRKFKLKK